MENAARPARIVCRIPTVALLAASIVASCPIAHASTDDDSHAALWEKVARDGSVRVIVRLAVAKPRTPGRTTGVARRTRIARARSSVVRELQGTRFAIRRSFETIPAVALEVDAVALAALEELRDVTHITEDVPHAPALEHSTPMIQALSAWAAGVTGAGQVVAVLDTGVDSAHPFLQGAIVHEACFSQSGHCPNGGRTQIGPGAAAPCTFATRACAHGTHVAGIVAGRSDDRSGVAPGAGIIAVQVFSRATDCREHEEVPCPRAYTSDYIRGLEYIHELRDHYPIAAVNLSFASGSYDSSRQCDERNGEVKDVIDELRHVGIATVVAAGNDRHAAALSLPACISSAISVGSVDADGRISDFSNRAPFLSLVAPGRSITSSIPGGGYGAKSGTSMAAPHVAGAWAVLRERDPWASVDLILSALSMTGSQVSEDGQGSFVPLIDVRAAHDYLAGACDCRSDVENFCDYPSDHCRMTAPGGYCDPNGDGKNADWARGWAEFQGACRTPETEPSPSRADLAPWARQTPNTPGDRTTRSIAFAKRAEVGR